MGLKTELSAYDKYVAKCKKDKVKPMDLLDFTIAYEG
jgi:hypothetical protein